MLPNRVHIYTVCGGTFVALKHSLWHWCSSLLFIFHPLIDLKQTLPSLLKGFQARVEPWTSLFRALGIKILIGSSILWIKDVVQPKLSIPDFTPVVCNHKTRLPGGLFEDAILGTLPWSKYAARPNFGLQNTELKVLLFGMRIYHNMCPLIRFSFISVCIATLIFSCSFNSFGIYVRTIQNVPSIYNRLGEGMWWEVSCATKKYYPQE